MNVLVYGSRLFGGVIRCLVEDSGHRFVGFIDDMYDGPEVLGSFDQVRSSHPPSEFACVNAVGYSNLPARARVTSRIRDARYVMPALVHPRAYVSTASAIGEGTFAMAGAVVDCRVAVGAGVVLWPGACVNHDSTIGENTFLSPNCTICGDCRIGRDCFIGAGAVVVSYAVMPDGTRVKALERYVTRRE